MVSIGMREEGTSDGTLDFGGGFVLPTSFELTRTSWAPFTEVRLDSRMGLSAQAGMRFDKPDDMDSVTSPRVRVAYEFGDSGFTVAGAWGKAFKLPSLYALGHPLVGNPDLAPERGESQEIELSQRLLNGKARWSATWFDGEFRNAIDFDSGPPPMLVNRNLVNTDGFELAGSLGISEQWLLDASVTHARSRIAATDAELRNRPEWRGGLSAHWSPTAALKFSAAATYVGSSLDSSIPTGDVRLDAYTRVDVSASGSCRRASRHTWPSTISQTRNTRSSSGSKRAASRRARASGCCCSHGFLDQLQLGRPVRGEPPIGKQQRQQ